MATFITTPIFYASGNPHTGHAYSGIVADIYHRFRQLSGEQNILITGTDEHGQKIAATAEAHNTDISVFVDEKASKFADLWPQLDIQANVIIRTTQPEHKSHINEVWQKLASKGDIYAGTYSGQYCVACEQYYSPRELNGDRCPVHKKPVKKVEEATYLFRLETYRQQLLEHYQQHPDFITPSHFQSSMIELLRAEPLESLSVSRVKHTWGIKVPNDHDHTIYVWIDALFSYITAIQLSGHSSKVIADTVHVLGKDILKFHALYWPIFLLALGLPLPKKLLVHGWWTIEGEKISKSNPATAVNPTIFSEQLSSDGLRYALVRQKPLFHDGNLAIEAFKETINADLANNLANLVKRNNTLILKHFHGVLIRDTKYEQDKECKQLLADCQSQISQVIRHYQQYDIYQVTLILKHNLDALNHFFHQRSPWLISKGQDPQHVKNTCFIVANILRQITLCYLPITPQLSTSILSEMRVDISTAILQSEIELRDITINSAISHFQRIKTALN